MATKLKPCALTPEHFAAFGAIIHHFARHEYLMQCLMGAIVEVPIVPISILTVELGYRARYNTLLSLMKAKPLPEAQLRRILTLLSTLNKRAGLRNAIAHQAWKEGTQPGSIRPIGISAQGGEATFKGLAQGEEEYTADKLRRIANELGRLYESFVAYLDREGLSRSIPQKMEANSNEISFSPGQP